MWRSLVWKEWREQRWKLAFGTALLAGFTFIGLRTRVMPDDVVVAFATFIGGMLLPLMVSMGLVAPERADGSLVRLLALPVPAWHVLAAKAAVGLAAVAGPVLIAAAVALLIAGGREMSPRDLLGWYGMALGIACAMFTWMTALGIRQPSEARAGLVGIAVVAGWSMLQFASALLFAGFLVRPDAWVVLVSPFGFILTRGHGVPGLPGGAGPVVVIQVAVALLLWAWAARRLAEPGRGA